jgi:predicted ATPase
VPATGFLGRSQELASVVELLARPDVRLLTLTGPGGTGKTRLALQAAAEASDAFPDGITWVPLAPLRDAALVPATAAQALEVQELPDRPLERSLHDALTGKRVLLLLDNAEHLLPDVAARVSALADTPGPSVLVTSRERLRTQGEHAYAVPPLSESDGTRLFVTRARQVDESFAQTPAVEELCRRLDDLPLALELAAARTAVFSAEQLLDRLSQRLDLLKGGRDVDPRQATLRATIDWSYELLGPPERRLFAALAVFAGGCSYEAAEEVAGADPDSLQSLIDKSLVRRRDAEGGSRYWMLATIHEFAVERLGELDDADAIRSMHAEYFAAFAELADPALRHGPAQQGWSERLAADYDNVRAAVDFALGSAPELALRLVGSVTFFVWLRGGFAEARAWVDASLARGAGLSPQLLARVHECGAVVAERVGDLDRETWHADESYRLYASVGDQQGLANALRERGKAASAGGNHEVARDIYTELVAHAERIGDAWNGAIGLNNLGDVALQVGDWERAVELCGRSSELRTSLGDRWGSALARGNVALAEIHLGRLADAGRSVHAALEDSLAVNGTMVISACLDCCCALASALGLQPEAARLIGAAERLWEELGVVVRESFEAALFTSTKGSVRAALGEAAFATELERGRGLTLDEAAALVFAVADRSKAGAD